MRRRLKPGGLLCQEYAQASCCARDEGGPFGAALFGGSLQTAMSCFGRKVTVVNVMVKRA